MKGPWPSWAARERQSNAAQATQDGRERPPVDMPPDFAVIRPVGAVRRWGGTLWRWDGARWHVLVDLSEGAL